MNALVALLLRALTSVANVVPRPALLAMARVAAPLLAPFLPTRTIRKNLRIIHSIAPEAWRGRVEDELVTETVRQQLFGLVDFFALIATSPEDIHRHVRIEGWERLQVELAKGRGIVLVSAHFGSWELAGASVAMQGVRIHAFYHEQLSPALDSFLASARRRSRMGMLHQYRGLRECLRALRAGDVVGFVADQDGSRDGVFLDFLGRLASLPRGPYEFARHAGCAVIPVNCQRLPDASYRLDIGEPFQVESVEAAARRMAAHFEAAILSQPEQWQLFYDRFWLRHVPKLESLGLIERARAEAARDRQLRSPDAPPSLPGPRLSPDQFTRLATYFYLPLLAASLGWMAYRGRLSASLLWSTSACHAIGLGIAVALLTIALSRILCFHFAWGRRMAATLSQLLGPVGLRQAVLLAAVSSSAEEAFFRGALQPEAGLVGASLLFGLVHFPAEPSLRAWTAFAVAMGFALGSLYEVTGGLAAPVLAHFLVNAVNLSWLAGSSDLSTDKPVTGHHAQFPSGVP